jgi:predicted small secreted protein
MSELSAMTFSPAHAETTFEMKNTMPSRVKRQGSFVLVVAAALAVAACTGGAGLDIGSVDHSCHVNNSDKALGSGCA